MMDERAIAGIRRMYREACSRIADADFLARHVPPSAYGSDHLLRVLGFEVLMKAALRIFAVKYPTAKHRYLELWERMPLEGRQEILGAAVNRLGGIRDPSSPSNAAVNLCNSKDLERVLNHAERFFTRARYQYEYFDGFTEEEQRAVEARWLERAAPQEEADIVTYAPEIDALITGLRALIQSRLPL